MFEGKSQGRREERYGDAGDARKTQVITFGIAEGKYEDAEAGVLATLLNAHEALRGEPGFEDLRIIASRSEAGVSQAIIETTWSSADDLSSYESTKATILDLVNGHPDEVVTGSVQAFDMDVVRDTKDVFVRMGFGAATTILGGILIGGLAIGAVIAATSDDAVASEEGTVISGPVASTSVEVIATDNAFDRGTILAIANEEFTVSFVNAGSAPHNVTFLTEEGGEPLAAGSATEQVVASGSSQTISFVAPDAGTYFYVCTLHPNEMTGTFTVTAGGAGGGDGSASSGGDVAATSVDVVATDNAFDSVTIVAIADEEFTVNFANEGDVFHNLTFLTEKGGEPLAEGSATEITVKAGEEVSFSFAAPSEGTYYYLCTLHPEDMNGTFRVDGS